MSTATYTALISAQPADLARLINTGPTMETMGDLTDAFNKIIREHPENTDVYASTLVEMISLVDGDLKISTPGENQGHGFVVSLYRGIFYIIEALLHTPSESSIRPTSRYLMASIISGGAMRAGLCFSSDQIGDIMCGLHFPRSGYRDLWGKDEYEIKAVGACVHALAAGKSIYNHGVITEVEMQKRLEGIGQWVQDPVGMRILEMTKEQAQKGFDQPLSLIEIWDALRA